MTEDQLRRGLAGSGVRLLGTSGRPPASLRAIVAGTAEDLLRLSIGNADAWRTLITDNLPANPRQDLAVYLVFRESGGSGTGEVRLLGGLGDADRIIRKWRAAP